MQERKIDTFIVKFDKEIKFSDESFYDTVVPISRPNDKAYSKYDFPKSRRVYEVGGENGMEVEVLGFVRLALI